MDDRKTRSDGDRSRDRILDTAARLATVQGLQGLSIGQVAAESGMSKSGVYGLFGSKEVLQMATVDRARDVFLAEVIAPAAGAAPGVAQMKALAGRYLDYSRRRVWPGGCFFRTVASEMGALAGPVRDRIAAEQKGWRSLFVSNAREAIRLGELRAGEDPQQLATEITCLLVGADIAFVLHGDARILNQVGAAIAARLR
ncbi:MAG TPA: TetR/AcrR family transcriptional regulator [Myxococcales bacterium]|nr:TetR/AcrR family transcriptional regulator [Myxococcales bacterium]